MVNVTHDNDDRRPADKLILSVLMVVNESLLDGHDDFLLDLAAKLHCDESGGIVVDYLGDGGKHAELEKLLYNLGRSLFHAGGKLTDTDFVGDLHLELLLLGDLKLEPVHLVALFLSALGGGSLRISALLRLAVDLLFVLTAHIAAVRLCARHVLKLLVVLFNVYRRAAAGIDHALLGNLTRDMNALLLRRGSSGSSGGGGSSGSRRCSLRGCPFLRLCVGRLCSFCVGRLLCRRRLCGRGLLRSLENLLKACRLIMLGEVFKYNIQLVIFENLHMVLGRGDIVSQNLSNFLG